jgi:hypothetical protein
MVSCVPSWDDGSTIYIPTNEKEKQKKIQKKIVHIQIIISRFFDIQPYTKK